MKIFPLVYPLFLEKYLEIITLKQIKFCKLFTKNTWKKTLWKELVFD